ncbi:hypothetical protein [Pedobacter jejuensis]|uniref:Uncharacterized protein n=1 Tax=Pedobacter jejuensis TaxID=1268550 RepID=A0A3N0C1I2_9SPHI|nr:hypothetical protein [Pedobacter jejuensis]RNL55592.1 hypothetical protein D7004_04605 [Pedobacter jejuensis]
MKNQKLLSEHQKRSLSNAIEALSTPIFSTGTSKSLKNNDLEDFLPRNSDTSLPLNATGVQNSPRPARRKNQNSSEENPKNGGYSQRQSHEKTSRVANFGFMDIPELPYTVPRIVKGRTIIKVPVGSTMEKEVAKQSWYVEFFFHNAAEERMERIRVTRKLNRIKDPRQKLKNFNNLCEAWINRFKLTPLRQSKKFPLAELI